MMLSTNQVAEKLGVTKHQVKTLVKNGFLKDHGVHKEGASKHYLVFDSKEVNEYKSEKPKAKKIQEIKPERVAKAIEPTGISTRLKSIEDKLDFLVRIWS